MDNFGQFGITKISNQVFRRLFLASGIYQVTYTPSQIGRTLADCEVIASQFANTCEDTSNPIDFA